MDKLNRQQIGGIALGAMNLLTGGITSGVQMAQVPENNFQQYINDLNAQSYNVGDYNELSNLFDSTQFAKTNYTTDDVFGNNGKAVGQIFANAAKGAGTGAALGTSVMPGWGTAIGAAAGFTSELLGSTLGYGVRKAKSRQQAYALNSAGQEANLNAINKMQNNAMNIGQNITNNAFLNMAAFGGKLDGNFNNGVRKIEEGGTHEQNPYDGVMQGIASDGLPNLVEEGELIWNDYVFSNRLNVPKSDKEMLGLKKKKNYKYAEAAEDIQKESEERPNDPISKNGLNVMMSRLEQSQEEYKAKRQQQKFQREFNKLSPEEQVMLLNAAMQQQSKSQDPYQQQYANGGHLFSGDNNSLLTRGVYRPFNSPLGSIQPSNRQTYLNSNLALDLSLPFPSYTTITLEELRRRIEEHTPPVLRQLKAEESDSNPNNGDSNPNKGIELPNTAYADVLKTAPIWNSLGMSIASLFDKPNYSNIERAERAAISVPKVSASPIGERMVYNPMDINYAMTQGINTSLGARRLANESSAGNRALAGNMVAANNYATMTGLGQLLTQGREYNNKLQQQVLDFNERTSQFNSQQSLAAQQANQQLGWNQAQMLYQTGQLRDNERAALQATRSANLNSLATNVGNYGTDMWNNAMKKWLTENHYYDWAKVTAQGGKLNTKKKGGKHA